MDNDRFDILGAAVQEPPKTPTTPLPPKKSDSWLASSATIFGAAVGLFLWSFFPRGGKKHPVLGALDGAALAGNITRVITRDISLRRGVLEPAHANGGAVDVQAYGLRLHS